MPAKRSTKKLNAAAFKALAAKQVSQRAARLPSSGAQGHCTASCLGAALPELTQEELSSADESSSSSYSIKTTTAASENTKIFDINLGLITLEKLLQRLGCMPARERSAVLSRACSTKGFRKRAVVHDLAAAKVEQQQEKLLIVASECPAVLGHGDALNCTVLHYSAAAPQALPPCSAGGGLLSTLLQQFPSQLRSIVNQASKAGVTPLHVAAGLLHPRAVSSLCAAGAGAAVPCKGGVPPTSYAVLAAIAHSNCSGCGQQPCCALGGVLDTLRQTGAGLWCPPSQVRADLKNLTSTSVTVVTGSAAEVAPDDNPSTGLQHWSGCVCASCRSLARGRAKVGSPPSRPSPLHVLQTHLDDTHEGLLASALHLACAFGTPVAVRAVLSAVHGGASQLSDREVTQATREYALQEVAASSTQWEMHARRLLHHGGGAGSVPCALLQPSSAPHCDCALLLACRMGNEAVVRMLLEVGADKGAFDAHGFSAFHAVCTGPVVGRAAPAICLKALHASPLWKTVQHLHTPSPSSEVISAAPVAAPPRCAYSFAALSEQDDAQRAGVASALLQAGCKCSAEEQRACVEAAIYARRSQLLIVLVRGGFPVQALLRRGEGGMPASCAGAAQQALAAACEQDIVLTPAVQQLLQHSRHPHTQALYGIHPLRGHDARAAGAEEAAKKRVAAGALSTAEYLHQMQQRKGVQVALAGLPTAQALQLVHAVRDHSAWLALRCGLFHQHMQRIQQEPGKADSIDILRWIHTQFPAGSAVLGLQQAADVRLQCSLCPSEGWRGLVEVSRPAPAPQQRAELARGIHVYAHARSLRACEYLAAAVRVTRGTAGGSSQSGAGGGGITPIDIRAPSLNALVILLWMTYWGCVPDTSLVQLLLMGVRGSPAACALQHCWAEHAAYILDLADALITSKVWAWPWAANLLEGAIARAFKRLQLTPPDGPRPVSACLPADRADAKLNAVLNEGLDGLHAVLLEAGVSSELLRGTPPVTGLIPRAAAPADLVQQTLNDACGIRCKHLLSQYMPNLGDQSAAYALLLELSGGSSTALALLSGEWPLVHGVLSAGGFLVQTASYHCTGLEVCGAGTAKENGGYAEGSVGFSAAGRVSAEAGRGSSRAGAPKPQQAPLEVVLPVSGEIHAIRDVGSSLLAELLTALRSCAAPGSGRGGVLHLLWQLHCMLVLYADASLDAVLLEEGEPALSHTCLLDALIVVSDMLHTNGGEVRLSSLQQAEGGAVGAMVVRVRALLAEAVLVRAVAIVSAGITPELQQAVLSKVQGAGLAGSTQGSSSITLLQLIVFCLGALRHHPAWCSTALW